MKKTDPAACPAKDVFVRAFLNELSRAETVRLLDHASGCPRCRLRFAALAGIRRQLASRSDLGLPGRPPARPSRVSGWAVRAAAALLVVIGVGLAGVGLLSRRPSVPRLRGVDGTALRVIAPEGPTRVPPARFEWTSVRNAEAYALEIVGPDLVTVFKDSGPRTSIVIPAPARRRLAKGVVYVWTVTAFSDDNRLLASSSGSFRVE